MGVDADWQRVHGPVVEVGAGDYMAHIAFKQE